MKLSPNFVVMNFFPLSSTGFAANVTNFNTTSKEIDFYDGTAKNISGFDVIKNEFFIVQDKNVDNNEFVQESSVSVMLP